jgi:outer membrane protein OmpA-like peptidoglycan-associated protein
MKQLFTALSFAIINISCAQNKDAIKLYNQAIFDKGLNKTEEAIASLRQAIEKDPTYSLARFELGKLLLAKKKYKEAAEPLLYIHTHDTNFTPAHIELLGDAYFGQEAYREAGYYYEKYVNNPFVDLHKNPYVFIKLANSDFSSANKIIHAVKFTNMGEAINGKGEEYFPSTNADESRLYFTKRKGSGLRDDEDIYVSSYVNNQWAQATPIAGNINTNENEGAHSIAPGGKFLIFTACNRKNQFVQTNSCDLYISKRNGDIWSTPNLMSSAINTSAWESQPTISADGKTLFFTSNRPGGFGGLDIWYCELNEKGVFGEPFNAGPEINTKFDEEKPFFHPDGQTLYFVSNGRAGYGGKDIFKTKKIGDIWLSPVNIGKPFNSREDETGIFINALGTKGYIASNRADGFGGMDVYTFEVPEYIQPNPTAFVKGMVTDQAGRPKAAKGAIIDFETNKVYYTFSTDSITGNYLATLPAGKIYLVNIHKEGYFFHSEKINLKNMSAKEIVQNISLIPIEKGNKIALHNTYFDTDKFDLKETSYAELDRLVEFMNVNPAASIEIGGHTDNSGSAEKNKLLSKNRAEAVQAYLIKKGIEDGRIRAVGYGSEKPIADNTTEAGRAQNRRTEIVIR